jgi:hypothetical protein
LKKKFIHIPTDHLFADKPRRLLATLLITSNLINIGIVLLSYSIFHVILPEDILLNWGTHLNAIVFSIGWIHGNGPLSYNS